MVANAHDEIANGSARAHHNEVVGGDFAELSLSLLSKRVARSYTKNEDLLVDCHPVGHFPDFILFQIRNFRNQVNDGFSAD